MDFFGFILFGIHTASWNYRFMPLAKFGKLSGIIYFNICLAINFFSSLPGTPMKRMLDLLLLSQRFPRLISVYFLLIRLNNFHWSIFSSQIYSSVISLPMRSPIVGFIFIIVIFSSNISIWFFFLYLQLFCWDFLLFHLFQVCSFFSSMHFYDSVFKILVR